MKRKILIITLIAAALVLALAAAAVLLLLGQRTSNTQPERIYITPGTTPSALHSQLSALHTPLSIVAFRIESRLLKLAPREGSYVVEPHMPTLSLVRKLRNGQQDPIRLTIGKFRTPQDLNVYLGKKLMHDDFDIPLDSFYIIRPDTYEFYWTVTPEQFMHRMAKEWKAESGKWKAGSDASDNLSTTHRPLSAHDIVVLASIVEEETNNNQEKPLIAGVYLNRLAKGMPLQSDPTVKYAVGDFTLRRILKQHLATESPFNTYLHTGLPPAPICLPSKTSVDAVLGAPETDFLYFCASDKMDGTHRFAATLAEHNRNAAAFHAALNRRGIK